MADTLDVTAAADVGDDVLQVWGTITHDDGSTEDIVGTGWVSTLSNHYDASAYGADGHRDPKATPRAMTSAESMVYYRTCLGFPPPPPVAEPTPDVPRVLFGNIPNG